MEFGIEFLFNGQMKKKTGKRQAFGVGEVETFHFNRVKCPV